MATPSPASAAPSTPAATRTPTTSSSASTSITPMTGCASTGARRCATPSSTTCPTVSAALITMTTRAARAPTSASTTTRCSAATTTPSSSRAATAGPMTRSRSTTSWSTTTCSSACSSRTTSRGTASAPGGPATSPSPTTTSIAAGRSPRSASTGPTPWSRPTARRPPPPPTGVRTGTSGTTMVRPSPFPETEQMRKVVVYMFTTLDGMIAGPNGEFDDHEPSEAEMDFANQLFGSAGGLLFGRPTYEGFAEYWDGLDLDDPSLSERERVFAQTFRTKPKFVFSRTRERLDGDATLIKGDLAAAVSELKQQPGGDLVLICGPELLSDLVQLGLVDEYRILVKPSVIGQGKGLFEAIRGKQRLELLSTHAFESGVVMHHYRSA